MATFRNVFSVKESSANCAHALNAIFADAGVNILKAHPVKLGNEDAVRIIYGSCLADPKADLTGEDRRNLASAFLKAGIAAGEYRQLLDRTNAPALFIEVYTPPVDAPWVARYVNPWIMHVVRPDAAYFEAHAAALADAMRVRFAPPAVA